MAERINQFLFRGPRNLDLTGIEGLGDAIGGIGKGIQRRRTANTLADLGIEASRLEQSIPPDAERLGTGSEGANAVLEPRSQFTPDTASNMDMKKAALIREAQIAIRRGASPQRVLQRLRRLGVNLDGVR